MPLPSARHPGNAPKPASLWKLRDRLFTALAHLATRFPGVVVAAVGLLAVLAYFYIQDFPIRTAYLDLLPQDDPLVKKFQEVEADTAGTDVVAVLLTLTSPPPTLEERRVVLEQAADRLIAELRLPETPELASASYRVGVGVKVPPELKIFRTLSAAELDRLRVITQEVQVELLPLPDLPSSWDEVAGDPAVGWTDPAVVEAALGKLVGGARTAVATLDRILAQKDLLAEAAQITGDVIHREVPEATGEPLLSQDATRLVVQIWPTRRPVESLVFNRVVTGLVRDAVRRASLEELGVSVGITGTYVTTVEADETIRRDMALVTIISSAAVFFLVLLAFASPLLCLTAVVPVLVSALFTMAWAKFAVGGVNLLTMFLPALILGLGIDNSVHILSRYVEERARRERVRDALTTAVRTKGGACLTAALTTTAVFTCLLLSHSRALWEMGAITGVGILLSLFTTVLLTPALVALTHRDHRPARRHPIISPAALRPAYRRFLRLRPGVVAMGILLTAAVLYQASQVQFRFVSDDLAPPTPSTRVVGTVTREFGGNVWVGHYFRFFVTDPEDIRPLENALAAHPLVHSTASIRRLLPQELLGGETSILNLPVAEARAAAEFLEGELRQWGARLAQLNAFIVDLAQAEFLAVAAGRTALAGALSQGVADVYRLLQELEALDVPHKRAQLSELTQYLRNVEEFVNKVVNLPPEGELLGEILRLLPAELRAVYFTNHTERYIVEARLLPRLLEGDNLRRFLDFADTLGVDRFGLPEVTAQLESYMRRDFLLSTALAVLIIFLLVWWDFPRPLEAGLALAPLVMGYVWMLAGMNLLGIAFNFTNIVISPLLIGIGVDSAVHLLHRVQEEQKSGGEATVRGAAASAVPMGVSSLTTIASFGALLAAHTPGLRLLGTSALLGLGFTLLWSLTFLPAAVATVVEKGGGKE